MRILIATSCLPWPLNSGGNVAQFSTLKCLAEDHQFTLVCRVDNPGQLAHVEELQAALPKLRIRGVVCTPKETDSVVVKALRSVLSLGRRLLKPKKKAPALDLPLYAFYLLPPPYIQALQEELDRGTDLFQAEFAEMLPLGAWLPQELPKLFIHHQIHFVYARRFVEARGIAPYSAYLNAVMQVQELACLQHFDTVITFSEQDRNTLHACLPALEVQNSPFPLPADVGIIAHATGDFDGRFLFLASEEHEPNQDALNWLLEKIWPDILRGFPPAKLVVIGQWSEAAIKRHSTASVSFAGFVNDLPAAMKNGIMLVPLRIGSGIRVKILAALAQGIPVVATPVGMEGLLVRDGKELLVREDAPGFAAAAVSLAQQPALRSALAQGGRNAVLEHYSPASVRRRRNEIYAKLVAGSRAAAAKGMPPAAV